MDDVVLSIVSPLSRLCPFAYLYYKTHHIGSEFLFPLSVLFCGIVASVVNGVSRASAYAYELHVFFLLLTPFSVLTCDPCWPRKLRRWKTEIILVLSAMTVVFSALFLDYIMISLLCYSLGPIGVYAFIAGESQWVKRGHNMLLVIGSVLMGILASLAFAGNDWQQSAGHFCVALACLFALIAMPIAESQMVLRPLAVPRPEESESSSFTIMAERNNDSGTAGDDEYNDAMQEVELEHQLPQPRVVPME